MIKGELRSFEWLDQNTALLQVYEEGNMQTWVLKNPTLVKFDVDFDESEAVKIEEFPVSCVEIKVKL